MPEVQEPGHEVICGTIGMGKSYWVLYKIIKSFLYDRPCCYIDPKGDTYRNLLAFFSDTTQGQEIWDAFRHRIILLNPVSPSDWLVGFNAIEPMGEFLSARPDQVALLANSLVSHIRRQSGFEMAEANRMQNIMSAGIGILVQGGGGKLTLAELPLLYRPAAKPVGKFAVRPPHNALVAALLPNVTHYGTLSFWRDQWPTWTPTAQREWVQSTEGRIFQYLFDERLLLTVCTTENSRLDFRKLVDGGYWLFVNIPYQLLSDTISTLLGNLLIAKIFYACMQRPPGARAYRLILDEARFFNTGPLEVLLETSRAYNLWLTMVVQSLEQMCRSIEGRVDARLKETAINNVRYWSVFHNSTDGRTLANLMFPLTGRVATGVRVSGDQDWLPVAAEQDQNERSFMQLGPRQVVWYDKLGGSPQVWRTPEVRMRQPEQGRLDLFEAAHLQVTGKPAAEIKREIMERQRRLREMLEGTPPAGPGRSAPPQPPDSPPPGRTLPPADFGRPL